MPSAQISSIWCWTRVLSHVVLNSFVQALVNATVIKPYQISTTTPPLRHVWVIVPWWVHYSWMDLTPMGVHVWWVSSAVASTSSFKPTPTCVSTHAMLVMLLMWTMFANSSAILIALLAMVTTTITVYHAPILNTISLYPLTLVSLSVHNHHHSMIIVLLDYAKYTVPNL
jgi:hypothetical protein